eukprot:GHVR01031990.1.p1 GENE.GHVR01031990.1~~GHVR01031990.1.p1  ORF type:complete len:156 (+),score=30.29 GHVR01031990.1:36-470(+)
MSESVYDNDNIFSGILDGKIPSYKIFETEHALAILDAFPVCRGHSLLIPKKRCVSLLDMDGDTAGNVLKDLPRLVRAVKEGTGADGVNVLQNNGTSAGQIVMHAHFHVIPRFEGDKSVSLGPSAKEMITSTTAQELIQSFKQHL